MNAIKNKLHNSRGASMIIALVFMMICLFVGGSVLVAATMNANRMRSEQQDEKSREYLSQRSAAHLIADELRMPGDESLRMNISIEKSTKQNIVFDDKGGYNVSKTVTDAEFHCNLIYPDGYILTPMQKLLYQSAVVNYVKEYVDAEKVKGNIVTIDQKGFNKVKFYDADGKKLDGWEFPSFLVAYKDDGKSAGGTFELIVPGAEMTPESATKIPAAYRCDYQKGQITTNYNFAVDFGNFSQLEVRMHASVGEHKTPEIEEIKDNHNGTGLRVIRKLEQKTISWSNPTIEKGKGVTE